MDNPEEMDNLPRLNQEKIETRNNRKYETDQSTVTSESVINNS